MSFCHWWNYSCTEIELLNRFLELCSNIVSYLQLLLVVSTDTIMIQFPTTTTRESHLKIFISAHWIRYVSLIYGNKSYTLYSPKNWYSLTEKLIIPFLTKTIIIFSFRDHRVLTGKYYFDPPDFQKQTF